LALASQRALETDEPISLTDRGLRRIGYVSPPGGALADAQEQLLFFVPKDMIGSLIGPMIDPMIGHEPAAKTASAASGQAKTGQRHSFDRSHGLEELYERHENPPPSPPLALGGGGEQDQNNNDQKAGHAQQSKDIIEPKRRIRSALPEARSAQELILPDTDSARALMAINILPEQIIELSHLSLTTIQAAIRDGQSRQGIRDLAGWVVHLLRNVRDHGWRVQPPSPHPDSPEALSAAWARYAAEQAAEYKGEPEILYHDPLAADDGAAMPDDTEKDATAQMRLISPEHPPTVAPVPVDLDRLWKATLATLQLQTARQEFNASFRGVVLRAVEGGVAMIAVPGAGIKETLENRYLGLLREILEYHLGCPVQVRIRLQGARTESDYAHDPRSTIRATACDRRAIDMPSTAAVEHDTRPAWIELARWEMLPRMLRAALIGSTLEEGVVRGKTDYLHCLLQARYATEVAALLG
jgi:hypothetical protein